jgi:hypothetical protein
VRRLGTAISIAGLGKPAGKNSLQRLVGCDLQIPPFVEGDITVSPNLRIFFALLLALGASLCLGTRALAETDPLPSWNAGPAKQAIVDFVQKTTDKSSPAFMPPAERIATFDNDGTLWPS